MLDLQVIGLVIITVGFSIASIVLISYLPNGKTFEDFLTERKKNRAQILGLGDVKSYQEPKKDKRKNKKKCSNTEPVAKNQFYENDNVKLKNHKSTSENKIQMVLAPNKNSFIAETACKNDKAPLVRENNNSYQNRTKKNEERTN